METLSEMEKLDVINGGLKLIRRTDGLTYGTDALLLAAYASSGKAAARLADLGGGTGVISLLYASRHPQTHIEILEVQSEFAALCRRNAALNGMEDRISVHECDLRNADSRRIGGEVDTVVSNPPYMRAGSGILNRSTAKTIARHETCGDITDFCQAAARLLKYHGSFFVVYRPDRLTDLLYALRASGLEPKKLTFVHPEAESPPSLLLCEARRGASPSMEITQPLYIYQSSTRLYTRQMQTILDKGEF